MKIYSYEMVASAFARWLSAQSNDTSCMLKNGCTEQLISQIKRHYPDERAMSEDAVRMVEALLKESPQHPVASKRIH